MSAGKFDLSYPAAAQIAMLPPREKAALKKFFSGDEIDKPPMTRVTGDGRFVSRLSGKLVLWRRSAQEKPEILSIVDQSFARSL